MATDSTELTFVRCPSCRSLVPAMSKTCRMCGAGLEAGVRSDESPDKRNSGRVRQRTMSQPDEEVAAATQQIREELKPAAVIAAPPPPPPASAPSLDFDDPLSAYVQEVPLVEEVPAPVQARPTPVAPTPPAQERNGAPQIAPASVSPARTATPSPGPSPVVRKEPEAEPSAPAEAKPKVIVETGKRGPKQGLSFGGQKNAERAPERSHEEKKADGHHDRRRFDERPKRDERRDDRRDERRNRPPERPHFDDDDSGSEGASFDAHETHEERPAARRDEPRREEPRRDRPERAPEPRRFDPPPRRDERKETREESREDRREEKREEKREERRDEGARRGDQDQPRSILVPRKSVGTGGRLAGWLVSYQDPDGRGIELREGKFFVSKNRVKDSDLVIDDKSVSSPHALVAIGTDNKMRIQDLMSDQGVFVKRRGESEYYRISETAELEHGDWIRFGVVEFHLCLVAHVGEK